MNQLLETLNEKTTELLVTHQKSHPITCNHYFTKALQKVRNKRDRDKYSKIIKQFFGVRTLEPSYINKSIDLRQLLNALAQQTEPDINRFACSEALDYMRAYYKVNLLFYPAPLLHSVLMSLCDFVSRFETLHRRHCYRGSRGQAHLSFDHHSLKALAKINKLTIRLKYSLAGIISLIAQCDKRYLCTEVAAKSYRNCRGPLPRYGSSGIATTALKLQWVVYCLAITFQRLQPVKSLKILNFRLQTLYLVACARPPDSLAHNPCHSDNFLPRPPYTIRIKKTVYN